MENLEDQVVALGMYAGLAMQTTMGKGWAKDWSNERIAEHSFNMAEAMINEYNKRLEKLVEDESER